MAGDEQKSIEAGMNAHVTKPIDPDQLFATLQKWIKPVAERAAVRKPQLLDASSESDQAQLPQSLPGFDLSAGLKRLRGNKRLYKKLLLDFGSQYTGVAGEISNALTAGDFEQAHSLVHNLKGLAGNLAATDLQAATVEIEKRVKGNQAKSSTAGQLNQKFTELEKAINQALKAVQTLGPSTEEVACEISEEMIAEVPAELIKGACSRIKEAVDTGDVMGVKSIAEELKAQSDAITPISDKFIQLAEDFDFDGILKFVGELSSESNH
jgi:HPt (histidine-containing phosphotransfer) domain-containing protein